MNAADWFLLAAIVGLAHTLNAMRPRRRPLAVVGFSFFSGWLTAELAEFHLVWQIVATVLFIAAGALGSWAGIVALVLTAISWAGLGSIISVALHTGAVMDTSLFQSKINTVSSESTRVPWARALWPKPRRRGVERIRNLQYVDDGTRRHRLDVYRPRDRSAAPAAGAPVLLQIHGGAWMIGTKEQQGLPLMYQMSQHGWVCVAINYRLSPKATWPDHLIDCKQALAWVKEHIATYGGDPENIVVTGGSAGGHLSALLGLTANDARFQPGFEAVDTSVRAFMPMYAIYDFTNRTGVRGKRDPLQRALERHIFKLMRADNLELFDLASPMSHVRDGVPPCFVVHGRVDTLAYVEDAREFVRLLRAVSTEPVAYAELPGANHAFDVFPSIRSLLAVERMERFANWAVSRPVATAAAGSAAGADEPETDPTTMARTAPSPSPPA